MVQPINSSRKSVVERYTKGLLHIGVNVEMANEQVQIKLFFFGYRLLQTIDLTF